MAKKNEDAVVEQATVQNVEDVKPDVRPEEDVKPVDDGKVDVELNGTPAEKTGEHIHFFDNVKRVVFHDGLARVEKDVAELLKELGLVK